jgi:hypothetical protein
MESWLPEISGEGGIRQPPGRGIQLFHPFIHSFLSFGTGSPFLLLPGFFCSGIVDSNRPLVASPVFSAFEAVHHATLTP